MGNRYGKSLKLYAVKCVIEEDRKIVEVAKELDILPQTLHKWVKTYKDSETSSNNKKVKTLDKYVRILEEENLILKRARKVEKSTEAMFEFINEHQKEFSVSRMCDVLEVSTSGYYKWRKGITSDRERNNHFLTRKIREIYINNGPAIGSPKITDLLKKQEIPVSQATVSRILKSNKKVWNTSHTAFHQEKDVTLNFPNKDCIWDQENNIFFQQELAKDEIAEMLSPKSFNITRINDSGETPISEFKDTDNLLIHSDNLVALHNLQSRFNKKVKLIYIDPPYNTHRYDLSHPDYFSHATYLVFLKNRLEAAKPLLKESGSIWIHCNDKEQAYIKVLCDEIFGRQNFVNQIVWKRTSSQQNTGHIANVKDYILVFAKNKKRLSLNRIPMSSRTLERYKYEDEQGKYRLDPIINRSSGYYNYKIKTPNEKELESNWNYPKITFQKLVEDNQIHWSISENIPYKKNYLKENAEQVPTDVWGNKLGTNLQAMTELNTMFPNHIFRYPKPENLLSYILYLASNEKDIVLDCFLGSGTSAVAAHKMERQYIGIEIDPLNFDLSKQRIQNLINNDKGNCIIIKERLNS